MPQRGDKMYRCFNGEVEVATFLEEGLSDPTCTVTTYLMRESNGRKFRCGKEMYLPSKREALARYLDECKEALPGAQQAVIDAQNHVKFVEGEISRITQEIIDLDLTDTR